MSRPPMMFEAKTFTHGGREWPYRIHVPECAGPWPLVMFLHGVGQRGGDNEQQVEIGAQDIVAWCVESGNPAVIVAPQCPEDQMWAAVRSDWTGVARLEDPPPAQGAVVALVRALREDLPVDPQRFYLTGLSMGGFGVWDILRRARELWAAALPICGGGLVEEAATLATIPIWTVHGAKDPLVPVHQSRRMVEALREAGSPIRYTEHPEAEHNVWDDTYRNPEVLEWLFAQNR